MTSVDHTPHRRHAAMMSDGRDELLVVKASGQMLPTMGRSSECRQAADGQFGAEMDEFVSLAAQLVGARRCSLLLPVEEGSGLRIAAAIAIHDEVIATTFVRAGVGIAGMVWQSRHPLLVNGEHPGLHSRPAATYHSSSFISVPVAFEPFGCGVLNVADPLRAASFSHDDLAALLSFAGVIGRSLVTTRMEQQYARAVRERAYLQQQIIAVQEEERGRLARELHDEAGHALATTIFKMDLEARALPPGSDAAPVLARVRDTLMACADTLHGLAFTLHPRILTDLGLVPALRSLIAQIEEIGGLQIAFTVLQTVPTLHPTVQLAAFRVVQEALNNVRKHAQTDRAWVTLDVTNDRLELTIEDRGIGLGVDLPTDDQRVTLGLGGMRERVELLGGRFALDSRDQGGLIVRASFPLGDTAPQR